MELVTTCSSCKNEIKVNYKANTRSELQMQVGDTVKLNCQNCGNFENKHVNKIRAKVSKVMLLLGFGIGVAAAVLLWFFFGAIGTAIFIIPIIFWQQQEKIAKGFNSYMIRRK